MQSRVLHIMLLFLPIMLCPDAHRVDLFCFNFLPILLAALSVPESVEVSVELLHSKFDSINTRVQGRRANTPRGVCNIT